MNLAFVASDGGGGGLAEKAGAGNEADDQCRGDEPASAVF